MLVFAFAPTLVAVPRWLYFEATNPLNLRDPVVLAFVPVRGFVLLLNTFSAGVVAGVIGGVIDGVLVCAWLWWCERASTVRRRMVLGATCGGVAAVAMVLVGFLSGIFEVGQLTSRPGAVAFEIVSGTVCGMIAAPTAMRLWNKAVGAGGAQPVACRAPR